MKNSSIRAAARVVAALLATLMLVSCSGCAKLREFFHIPGGGPDETGLSPDGSGDESGEHDPNASPEDTKPTVIIPEVPDLTFPEPATTVLPEIYRDPLTAMLARYDVTALRPAMIVYDNCNAASPQSGIGRAGVVIEVPTNNGQTILCGIHNDMIGQTGSELYGPIAEANCNALSVSRAFDAYLLCSGRDEAADEAIYEAAGDPNSRLAVIDALNEEQAPEGFWRDIERIKQYGYTHSMCITAVAAASIPVQFGINVQSASPLADLFSFAPNGWNVPTGAQSKHVVITYSQYQRIQLIYDNKNNVYIRYQFGAKPHTDSETGASLAFANVVILNAPATDLGDGVLRITGTGTGTFITAGKSNAIIWSRADENAPFSFRMTNSKEPVFNAGKTLICILPSSVSESGGVILDYNAKRDGDLK